MQSSDGALLSLALARMGFLTASERVLLQKKLDGTASLAVLSIEEISVLIGRGVQTVLWPQQDLLRRVERDRLIMERYRISSCVYGSGWYPALLAEIYDPPYMLFWRGNFACVQTAGAALVGTRRPTAAGMKAAFEAGRDLAAQGITVVSGLASGIDSYAHRGALEAARSPAAGKTCAVLASGADDFTPAANRRLGASILELGGCIVSEYPPETPPQKWQFPQRNRLISGLCGVVAVIEAPAGSGSLITADFALEQGRELVFHQCAQTSAAFFERTRPASMPNPLPAANKKKRSAADYIAEGAPIVRNGEEIGAVLKNAHFGAARRVDGDQISLQFTDG